VEGTYRPAGGGGRAAELLQQRGARVAREASARHAARIMEMPQWRGACGAWQWWRVLQAMLLGGGERTPGRRGVALTACSDYCIAG